MAASKSIKVLSLFSNIGVAEAYLESIGVEVLLANEIDKRRADIYSKIYKNCEMICGDIRDAHVSRDIVQKSIEKKINTIIATPPCQGMSTAGRQLENDDRNLLITYAVNIIKQVKPFYVMFENVPLFFNTTIVVNNKKVNILDYINRELGEFYNIEAQVINVQDFEVPQSRERAIVLLTKKDEEITKWEMPEKSNSMFTMKDAIGHLPQLDPFIKDLSEEDRSRIFPLYKKRREEARKISIWHKPPEHCYRQVLAMQYTPTGKTAFDNPIHYPKKLDGNAVRGYRNTYKRQNWDTPAYTVTMDNRKISSQNNVHPGRLIGKDEHGDDLYSDARCLTLYELMLIMSLPPNWPIPDNASEAFIRRIIGEGIPPLFVKKLFQNIIGG